MENEFNLLEEMKGCLKFGRGNLFNFIRDLEAQEKFINDFCGPDWDNDITAIGTKIYWKTCLLTEVAELIELLPYKRWGEEKKVYTGEDKFRILMEFSDIYSFLLSSILRYVKNKTSLDFLIDTIDSTSSVRIKEFDPVKNKGDILGYCQRLIMKMDKYEVHDSLRIFIELLGSLGFNYNDLRLFHYPKRELCMFRRKMLKKNGAYSKVWKDGKDDIYYLHIICNNAFKIGEDIFNTVDIKDIEKQYMKINHPEYDEGESLFKELE